MPDIPPTIREAYEKMLSDCFEISEDEKRPVYASTRRVLGEHIERLEASMDRLLSNYPGLGDE